MRLTAPHHRLIRFGTFELDLHAGELRRNGSKVKLQEQPFQILALLLEHPGEVVTREELRQKLWPGGTFVDFEHSLNAAIKRLRNALDDSAAHPRFIETLPRRGYRLIAPVEAHPSPPKKSARTILPNWWKRPLSWLDWVAVVALLALAATGYFAWKLHWVPPIQPTERTMLAVLPFEDFSGQSEEHFCNGLTEEMITQLGRLAPERLGVIARTSALQYKGVDKPIDEIGKELGVDYILEGSVRREADRVRISVQLIRVSDQTHVWAENYDRDLHDILLLQGEVAQAVAQKIEIRITPRERIRLAEARPVHPEAHEDYLRGRYYWNKRTAEGLERGRDYFERALDKDPLYALAYSGLADTYTNLTWYGILPPKEAMPRAKAAALRALEIDETLAEAHASLGMAVFYYDWDWSLAERELKRAIELNPGYLTALYWYAVFLADLGRADESIRAMKQALEADPLSVRARCDVGWTLFFARRYDEAIEQFRKTLELNPDFPMAHHLLGEAYAENGMFDEAVEELGRALSLLPRSTHVKAMIGYTHARSGNREEALRILNELQEGTNQARYGRDLATLCGALGDKDQAFMWLERAIEYRAPWLVRLGVEPWYDSLRDDPRFDEMLRRMKWPGH